MIQLVTYFNRSITLQEYRSLLGLAPGHHNVDIGMEKIIQLKIMKESLNGQGLKVYGIVDMKTMVSRNNSMSYFWRETWRSKQERPRKVREKHM